MDWMEGEPRNASEEKGMWYAAVCSPLSMIIAVRVVEPETHCSYTRGKVNGFAGVMGRRGG